MEPALSSAQVIVIGSGAGGATAAWYLASKGYRVTLIEEGATHDKSSFKASAFSAMHNLFRDFGTQAGKTQGSLIPIMQGRAVGGTTVISGAVMHSLPQSCHEEWSSLDSKFAAALPYAEVMNAEKLLHAPLGISTGFADIQFRIPAFQNLLQMGWKPNVMLRSAPNCQGTGRCLQGCPSGGKWSMNNSLIPDFIKNKGVLLPNTKVIKLLWRNKQIKALLVQDVATRKTKKIPITCPLILAGGAVQSPLLLFRSGLKKISPRLGIGFQCHLSSGVVGELGQSAFEIDGPPQGLEAQSQEPRIKLATQLVPPELILARVGLIGESLKRTLQNFHKLSAWTCSVRSNARGTIKPNLFDFSRTAKISLQPGSEDLKLMAHGLQELIRLLFKNGASQVWHGVNGWPDPITRVDDIPTSTPKIQDLVLGAGHLFGGCKMSSEPMDPVDLNFNFRGIENLFVADASIFPSNIGVNPQLSIMSLALLAAQKVEKCIS